ncbi:MAG: HlyD family secretion protein, partial [Rhizobiaceae bacterium]|nr:HlyD family secretion protein [Rhizobiaceae bacterium]
MSNTPNIQPDDPEPAAAPAPPSPTIRRRARRLAIGVGCLLALLVIWEILTSIVVYTDDAYVSSDFVAVAPQVTGVVVSLDVANNQQVKRGDLLAVIDKVPFQLIVAQRRAAVQEAEADRNALANDLANARARLSAANDGHAVLTTDQAAATQRPEAESAQMSEQVSLDKASQSVARQEAVVAQAQAALALAEWQLEQTDIRAPVDGTVNNLTVSVGDTATTGKPLIGIVDAAGWRIVANYQESYVRHLQPAKTAWVWLDTHPWRLYRAEIEGVARGISRGPDQDGILPYVAPTTDWIRLRRRF